MFAVACGPTNHTPGLFGYLARCAPQIRQKKLSAIRLLVVYPQGGANTDVDKVDVAEFIVHRTDAVDAHGGAFDVVW
jgi:hypothetical protein